MLAGELAGELLEPLAAPRDQCDAVTTPGKRPRQLGADPRGRAGYEAG
jgi:hypothetical protein